MYNPQAERAEARVKTYNQGLCPWRNNETYYKKIFDYRRSGGACNRCNHLGVQFDWTRRSAVPQQRQDQRNS